MPDTPRPFHSFKAPPRFVQQVRAGLSAGRSVRAVAAYLGVPERTIRFVGECLRETQVISDAAAAALDTRTHTATK
jgi:hypothetical protein